MKYTLTEAEFSGCLDYCWSLTREWLEGSGRCCFVMLNPSTADALKDDPTIRRCVDFARRWGHSALDVVNLFPLRTPSPKVLKASTDLLGHAYRKPGRMLDADEVVCRVAARARTVVVAWGNDGAWLARDRVVLNLLSNLELHALGITAKGQPWHPLYVPAQTQLVRYAGPVAEVSAHA